MKRTVTRSTMIMVVTLLSLTTSLFARSHRVDQIPNGSELGCASCHVTPGGPRTAFGTLIENSYLSGGNVVWGPELAAADADGDGFSNGHELEDPFGVWTSGSTNPGNTSFVTNPGSNSSVPEGDAAKSSFQMQFTDMTPHVGQYFEIRIVDTSNDLTVASEDLSSIGDAAYEFVFLHALEDGASYQVDFWADHNGNGTYDAPPTDHAWRVDLASVSGNTMESFSHNTNFTDIGGTVSIDHLAAVPTELVLYDNYPNPFNPETVIRYELAAPGFVELNVYNLQGAQVATLQSGVRQAGLQSVAWNARNYRGEQLPAGIYIYTLRADGQMHSKRMMLLK
ncbi:MAG: T9SS type A sorting domain-containing protein [FCB group bacterium]|nr:T9SS type A sorting domain-containing protein [FCB group bacterium]MBL7120349.1 T9SS type A sorting domain-containing protein [Candidatus Neomarinimicrobiota bacterium]